MSKNTEPDTALNNLIQELGIYNSITYPIRPKYSSTFNSRPYYELLGLTVDNNISGAITMQSSDKFALIDLNTLTERDGEKSGGNKISENARYFSPVGTDSMILAKVISRQLATLSSGVCGEKVVEKKYIKYVFHGRTIMPNQSLQDKSIDENETGLIFQPSIRMMSDQSTIFPNPGSETLNIKLGNLTQRIEAYDTKGKLILMINGNNANQYIDVNTSSWPAGLYVIKLFGLDNNVIESHKWIKIN